MIANYFNIISKLDSSKIYIYVYLQNNFHYIRNIEYIIHFPIVTNVRNIILL